MNVRMPPSLKAVPMQIDLLVDFHECSTQSETTIKHQSSASVDQQFLLDNTDLYDIS